MKQRILFLHLLTVLAAFSAVAQTPSAGAKAHVIFRESDQQRYGFDAFRFEEWEDDYNSWKNDLNEDYRIAYKSVGYEQTDRVDAHIVNGRRLDADSLSFHVMGTLQPIRFTVRSRYVVTLDLPAMTKNYTVAAYYGTTELGQLQVVVYRPKTEKVIVVPLTEMDIDRDSLQNYLNGIYRQANLQLNVELQPLFRHEELDPKVLLDNPSPQFERYTEQMRDLRNLYFDNRPNADRDAFYIFLVPGFVNERITGYMVRNKAVAFVRADEKSYRLSIARQLARGIGMQKDSWEDKGPKRGTTDNLMDRPAGMHLRFVQWEDLRRSPHTYSIYDNYENVQTNNGLVAYYFWKENADGDIVTGKGSLLLAIRRPFKKNYQSYHLNIDNVFFQPVFRIKGRLINTWHILAALAVCTGVFFLGRLVNKKLITRYFVKPFWIRFILRIAQVFVGAGLVYGSFLLVNRGYGWYEVRSGHIAELDNKSVYRAVTAIADNVNYRHPARNDLASELLIRTGGTWTMRMHRQVLYFTVKQGEDGEWNRLRFLADRDSLILETLDFSDKAESHYIVFNFTRSDGSFERQQVFNHLGIDITEKLRIADPSKRILLFVNGYRPTSLGRTFEENFRDIQTKGLEFPDSKNLVYGFDRYDYWRPWQAIDLLFKKRINPGETFYADGHFSVSTSNHRSLVGFSTTSSIYPKRCTNHKRHVCWSTTSVQTGFFSSRKVKTVSLLTTAPNKKGFEKRRRNGRIAGKNIYQMLNELPNRSENDTLYIVAHSMGYAYALGIIDELRGKIRFGSLYIIAPENASSGTIDPTEWNEVWQYGSNFNRNVYDAPCLLDGVAPQAPVSGLKSHHRVYIPRNLYQKKGFFDSHFIGYYTWVLDIPKGKKGYIRQR